MSDPSSGEYPYHTAVYAEAGGLQELPCKHCRPGEPCAKARGTFEPHPETDASMFIQWKGTDVCLDFHCPCQPEETAYAFHFDGDFAYYLQCPKCLAVYEMGTQVKARKIDPEQIPDIEPKMLEAD
jgi:hypothetical protein